MIRRLLSYVGILLPEDQEITVTEVDEWVDPSEVDLSDIEATYEALCSSEALEPGEITPESIERVLRSLKAPEPPWYHDHPAVTMDRWEHRAHDRCGEWLNFFMETHPVGRHMVEENIDEPDRLEHFQRIIMSIWN